MHYTLYLRSESAAYCCDVILFMNSWKGIKCVTQLNRARARSLNMFRRRQTILNVEFMQFHSFRQQEPIAIHIYRNSIQKCNIMANVGLNSAQMLPRFLLPKLSWQAPIRLNSIRALSTLSPSHCNGPPKLSQRGVRRP